MKTKLKVESSGTTIDLDGDLVGDLTKIFTDLAAAARGPVVRLRLAKLRHISTPGIAQWIAFRKALVAPVELHECPATFVDYANLVSGVVEGARVVSFEIPLSCKSCGKSLALMIDAAVVKSAADVNLPACPACSAVLEAEVPLEDFLAFLPG